jgi:hypothetical protein
VVWATLIVTLVLILLTPAPARSEEPWLLWVSFRTAVFEIHPDRTDAMPRRLTSSDERALVPNQLSNQTAAQCRRLLATTRDQLASRLQAQHPTFSFTVDENMIEVAKREGQLISVTTYRYQCSPLNSRP